MALPRPTRVGAFVCPRGVFAIVCRDAPSGVEVERTFEAPFGLRTAEEAADHLVSMLQSAGIARASVSIAIRGFGVAHHSLQMPPANDALLGPVIEREMRRLEPQLGECAVQWVSLPPLDSGLTGAPTAPPQRSILATAAPADVIAVFEQRLHDAGHRLEHLTTLPIAVQRLMEQFDSGTGTIATVVPLPDGAYIGFMLSGGVRLVVEPPLPQDQAHEAAALAEEIDLATTFVRQQFRGASIDRVALIGLRASLTELKTTIAERLRIPAKQIEAETLTPVGFMALGAVLDARSADPQSLGGATRANAVSPALSRLETASLVAVFILALVGLWTIAETFRTVRAERALQTALHSIEQDDFSLAPVRETASQRRMVSHALEAVRLSAADRVEIQSALAGVAAVMRPPARVDTVRLAWSDGKWHAVLVGGIESTSNARAVQTLHDFYRELPQRIPLDSLSLERLAYGDADATPGVDRGSVQFRLSFALQSRAGAR
ncbi:MAG: hypothetical protein ACREOK_02270 [Gemmatimonadaceae bacterium]